MSCVPTLLVQTLPSTSWRSPTKFSWTRLSLYSAANGYHLISSVLGSRLPSEPWYIVSNHSVPCLSNSSERLPTGASDLNFVTGNSVSLSVLGSNLEMKGSPKSEYHTAPWASTMTSCGSVVDRGRSYSVMMARVARPVGRGKVLRGYS